MKKTTFKTITNKSFTTNKEIPLRIIADNGETQMSVDIYPLTRGEEKELGINWSAMGTMDTTDTYLFTELLTEAIRIIATYNINNK